MKVLQLTSVALLTASASLGFALPLQTDGGDPAATDSAPQADEQGIADGPAVTFQDAALAAQAQVQAATDELNAIKEQMALEQIPLSKQVNELQSQLTELRADYQRTVSLLASRNLDVGKLEDEIQARKDEANFLVNRLAEYRRNFESRIHITELERYADQIGEAKLADGNANLSPAELFASQGLIVETSLSRIEEAFGGTVFEGTAIATDGFQKDGRVVLNGPVAIFRSNDGGHVGMAERRLGGSLEPNVIPFGNPMDADAAAGLVSNGGGMLPLDATLGNAFKVEGTKETFIEHVKKGGTVMIPIFAMAGTALLVALFKWLSMLFIRKPSKKRMAALLTAVEKGDDDGARDAVSRLGGPVGRMLKVGVEHLDEPRDLIEESMYETVLTSRLRLNSFLPFIAICAASAPLMGLLGTVTGIINTFKMITVFGSGDVKSLSGGISEALITTKFGLIVAIPSLLLHAFLSRKAKGVVDSMEKAGVAFANSVERRQVRAGGERLVMPEGGFHIGGDASLDDDAVRAKVAQVLGEMIAPQVRQRTPGSETGRTS